MLKITISGPCASGKTTPAQAFAQFLESKGFTVDVSDTDLRAPGSIRPEEFHNRCMEAVAEKGPVLIDVVQTNHDGTERKPSFIPGEPIEILVHGTVDNGTWEPAHVAGNPHYHGMPDRVRVDQNGVQMCWLRDEARVPRL